MLIVVPKSASFENNLTLLDFIEKVQLKNVHLKIGVFFPHNAASEDIQKMFEWFWNHRIINIFIAFYSNSTVKQGSNLKPLLNIFNFNPFGSFSVVDVTETKFIHNIFPDKKINFQKYPIRLAVINDDSITQYSSTVPFIGGPDEKMWMSVFSVLNASYSIYWVRKVMQQLEILDNGTVDIHADLSELTETRYVTLYPMIIEILSMVVPKPLPYPAFSAYIQTMFSDGLLGYISILIIVITLLLALCRYIKSKRFLIFQCAADVINLLLNDNGAIIYQQLTRSELFLIVPLTLAGFVIVNGFLSNLQSHFTQPKLQPQIDTIVDFYRSSLPISTPNEFWMAKVTKLLNNLLNYEGWGNRMKVHNSSEVIQQIVTEAKFSFFEYESTAKGICKHKKFHITEIQLSWIWFKYDMRYDFPFIERVNEIVQWIQTAGLYNKWWRDLDEEKLFITFANESYVKSFSVPIFIVYGWIAGVIVFIIEIIWHSICRLFKFRKISC